MYSRQNTASSPLQLNVMGTNAAANDAIGYSQQLAVAGPDSMQMTLVQLLSQHQHQNGWIVLIAPTQVPDKLLAECYHLPMNKILVVHQKQITDLCSTVEAALRAKGCKVVINFGSELDPLQLTCCQQLAAEHQTWFYQFQQPNATHFSH